MTAGDEPQTWHHGIVARWWAEFNLTGLEISYFQKFIECEVERRLTLVLDVDGCDLSPDSPT